MVVLLLFINKYNILYMDVNTVNATSGGSGNNAVNSSTTIDPKKLFPQIGFSQ